MFYTLCYDQNLTQIALLNPGVEVQLIQRFYHFHEWQFWQQIVRPDWRYLQKATIIIDTGYPHDGRADNTAYRHDRRADKRRYPHDREIDIQMLKMFRNGYILSW